MAPSMRREAPPLSDADRRRDPRVLTLRTAKLSWFGQLQPIQCAVLDLSAGGACILVPEDLKVPLVVSLELEQPPGPPHRCRVRWRRGAKLGLAFKD